MSKAKSLTPKEWEEVFRIRCRSKRGDSVSDAESLLCSRAFNEDPLRYGEMQADVFDATVPFGSQAKYPRKPTSGKDA